MVPILPIIVEHQKEGDKATIARQLKSKDTGRRAIVVAFDNDKVPFLEYRGNEFLGTGSYRYIFIGGWMKLIKWRLIRVS